MDEATGTVRVGSIWSANDLDDGWAAWGMLDVDDDIVLIKAVDETLWPALEAARPNRRVRAAGTWKTEVVKPKGYLEGWTYRRLIITELEVLDA